MSIILLVLCAAFLMLCVADYLGKIRHVGIRSILDKWVWANRADESDALGRYK